MQVRTQGVLHPRSATHREVGHMSGMFGYCTHDPIGISSVAIHVVSGQEDFVLRLQHKGVAGIAERKISFSGRRHARLWQRVLNQKESSNELPQG